MKKNIIDNVHFEIFDELLVFASEKMRYKVSDNIFYENESGQDYAIMMKINISFKLYGL
jgi:hypothetical protein